MAVSKTDFVRGLQCKKMLWLDAHAPEYKIIPPEVQARLDAGHEFGDQAMSIFGEFVETTTFRDDGRLNFAAMLEKTRTLLAAGERVICEGSFSWYGNFCAADILKKEENGYALYEVKNTYFPRQEFITDLGFQRLILRKCGVPIISCNLILRGDEPPQDAVDSKLGEAETFLEHGEFLYKLVDVSKAARKADFMASNCVFELGKLKKKDAAMPEIPMGEHCNCPYQCWYQEYCSKSKE